MGIIALKREEKFWEKKVLLVVSLRNSNFAEKNW